MLASIVGEIEETNVKQGDPIEIKCTIDEHNDDIIVYWMADSDRYDCRASSQDIVDNGCYTAGSISFLLLRDTSSLTVGKHRVQCVIWQNLSPEFMEDTSFDSEFNSVSETGTLTVLEGELISIHLYVSCCITFSYDHMVFVCTCNVYSGTSLSQDRKRKCVRKYFQGLKCVQELLKRVFL